MQNKFLGKLIEKIFRNVKKINVRLLRIKITIFLFFIFKNNEALKFKTTK